MTATVSIFSEPEFVMRIAVTAETDTAEPRVAATPETIKKFAALGADVAVQSGAGAGAGFSDADYAAAGATIAETPRPRSPAPMSCCACADPPASELAGAKPGLAVISIMDPFGDESALAELAQAGAIAFAMEFMPRITRAQSMDVLSSQANIAGYRAVIDAAAEYGRSFPMMMTAAGTVPAAKSLHHGRRRRGAAGDRDGAAPRRHRHRDRRAPGHQGAGRIARREILAVENEEFQQAQTAGGYAKEMSPEYQAAQAELVASAYRQAGHRHHHGAHPRPTGAAGSSRRTWCARCAPARSSSISRPSAAATAN